MSLIGGYVGDSFLKGIGMGNNSWQYAMVQGAVSSATSGGINAMINDTKLSRGILQGMASGAATGAVMWGIGKSVTSRVAQWENNDIVITGSRRLGEPIPTDPNDPRVVRPEVNFDKPYDTETEAKDALNTDILAAKEAGNSRWEYGGLTVRHEVDGVTTYYNTNIVTSSSSDWIAWYGPSLLGINVSTPILAMHHYHPLHIRRGIGINRLRVVPRRFSDFDMKMYNLLTTNGVSELDGLYMVDNYGPRVYRGGRDPRGIACPNGIGDC